MPLFLPRLTVVMLSGTGPHCSCPPRTQEPQGPTGYQLSERPPDGQKGREKGFILAPDNYQFTCLSVCLSVCLSYLNISSACALPLLQLKRKKKIKSIVKAIITDISAFISRKGQAHICSDNRNNLPCCNCVPLTLYWLVSRPGAGSPGCPIAVQLA